MRQLYPRPSHHTGELTLQQVRAQDPGFDRLFEANYEAYLNYLAAVKNGDPQLIKKTDNEKAEASKRLDDYEIAQGYIRADGVALSSPRRSRYNGRNTYRSPRRYRY
jgi:hypothetical protein